MRRWFSFTRANATSRSAEERAEKTTSPSTGMGAKEALLLEAKTGQQRTLRLPPLTGPFKQLGFVDVEFTPPSVDSSNASSPTNSGRGSEVSVQSQPTAVYARIYYPAAEIAEAEFRSRRAPWIPSAPYYASYGYFVRLPWLLSQAVTRYLVSTARIPAVEGLMLHPDTPSLRLVIFSHGMGAMRTTSSAYCTQLASHGFIVACLEHRDGSACLTMLDRHATPMTYLHPTKAMRDLPHDARKYNDEVFARAIGEHSWRHAQLQKRAQEVRTVADCLLSVYDDALVKTWSPLETHSSILHALRQRCKDSSPVVAGHSFGAATAIMAASMDRRFRICWALDPWLFPLPEEHPSQWMQSSAFDLLTINSYSFQWAENLFAIRRLDRHLSSPPIAGAEPNSVAQLTLMGSTHQEFGDFPCLVSPSVIRFVRGASGSIDPEMAIHTTVAACLRFFSHRFGHVVDKNGMLTSPDCCIARLFSPAVSDGREVAHAGWNRAVEVAEEVFGSHSWSPTFFPIIEDLLRVDYFDMTSNRSSGASSTMPSRKTSSSSDGKEVVHAE